MAFTGFQKVKQPWVGILRQLRELFTAAEGTDNAATISVPLTLTTDPAGTPATNTLYKANIVKAWIRFDGTAVTSPAAMTGVDASFNVASVLDNGPGNYTIAWDVDFSSDNYAVVGTARHAAGVDSVSPLSFVIDPVAGSVQIFCARPTNTTYDPTSVCLIAVGDQ